MRQRNRTSLVVLVLALLLAAFVVACGPTSYVEGGGGSSPDASSVADAQDAPPPVDAGMLMMPDGNMVLPECVDGASRQGTCAPTGLMCTANLQFCRLGRWSECHPSIRSGCTEGVTDAGVLDVGSPDAVVADNGPTPPANCPIVGRGTTCLHGTECVSGVCVDGSNSLVRCADGALTLTRACPTIIDASVLDVNVLDTGSSDVADAGSPDVFVPANCASPFGVCLHGTECYRNVCADGTFTRGRCTNGVFVATRVCPVPDAGTDAGSPDVGVDVRDAVPDTVIEASVDIPVDVSSDVGATDARDVADVSDVSADAGSPDVVLTVDTITVTGLMGWTVTTFNTSVFADTGGGAVSMVCTPNLTTNPPSATCVGTVTAPFRVSTQIVGSGLSGLPIPGVSNFWDPGVWSGATCTALTTVRAVLTGGRTVTCTTATNNRGGCDHICR